MRLSAGQVHDAMKAIGMIGAPDDRRIIPQIAKYRLAKIHDLLEPIFTPIEARRLALVKQYGSEKVDPQTQRPLGWGLFADDENFPKYLEEWQAVRAEDCGDINIKPIPLGMLGNDPNGIQMQEFTLLGPIILNNLPEE